MEKERRIYIKSFILHYRRINTQQENNKGVYIISSYVAYLVRYILISFLKVYCHFFIIYIWFQFPIIVICIALPVHYFSNIFLLICTTCAESEKLFQVIVFFVFFKILNIAAEYSYKHLSIVIQLQIMQSTFINELRISTFQSISVIINIYFYVYMAVLQFYILP